MNTQTNAPAKDEFSIHPATLLGHVSLSCQSGKSDRLLHPGARIQTPLARRGIKPGLGAGGADLLRLTEEPDLKKYRRVTGLYHFAVLFPDRRQLAIAVARLFAFKYRNHPTDHIMTKTTYLDDPEGNGIELYAESPEDGIFTIENNDFVTRRADGTLSDGREPLDVDALFSHLKADDKLDVPIPPETRVGHVHLHVRNVQEAVDFYHGIIGF
ncbi:MAG: glyoxalase, partial [Anaerolineales bacterium]|nr:glyoxalase [Anaerolineales bacterium]